MIVDAHSIKAEHFSEDLGDDCLEFTPRVFERRA